MIRIIWKHQCSIFSFCSLNKSVIFICIVFTCIYIAKTQSASLYSNHSYHLSSIAFFHFVPQFKLHWHCSSPIINGYSFCTRYTSVNNFIVSNDSNHLKHSKSVGLISIRLFLILPYISLYCRNRFVFKSFETFMYCKIISICFPVQSVIFNMIIIYFIHKYSSMSSPFVLAILHLITL